jgi:hypothetical protein
VRPEVSSGRGRLLSPSLPSLRPLSHEAAGAKEREEGSKEERDSQWPHSLDRLPHPPGTGHRLEAPTSSRLTGNLPGQPESHASGESRKSHSSSGLLPDAPRLHPDTKGEERDARCGTPRSLVTAATT